MFNWFRLDSVEIIVNWYVNFQDNHFVFGILSIKKTKQTTKCTSITQFETEETKKTKASSILLHMSSLCSSNSSIFNCDEL